MIDDFQEMANEFQEECSVLLENMETSLMELQDSGYDNDHISSVFRAAHTIKGSGGIFEITPLVSFTHVAENLLDKIRNKDLELTDGQIDTLLDSKDYIEDLITFCVDNNSDDIPEELKQTGDVLLEQLKQHMDPNGKPLEEKTEIEEVKPKVEPDPIEVEKEEVKEEDIGDKNIYNIEVEFLQGAVENGIEPSEFISFLKKLGEISEINTKFVDGNIKFVLRFLSNKTESDVFKIFDLAKEFVKVEINGKLNLENSETTIEEPKIEKKEPVTKEPISKEPVKIKPAKKEIVDKEKSTVKKHHSTTLRVDSEKVDQLINQIGEMVIANASLLQKINEDKNKDLIESSSNVTSMLDDLRELSMKIRMVPIGETFSRFKRIVRDVSKELGKNIDFETSGEDTEVDKTVTEKIVDPLVHLVRNSLDHGIETPEVRIAKGKPARGTLKLSAYHDSGSIVIQIIDDGAGINTDIIFNKAVEKGIVDADANLTKQETLNLIFAAGFSTAEKITNLSGRGVGMDVVRRNIEELRGSVSIESVLGKGTTMTIKLPLTLAIIDGFLFKMGDVYYTVPLDMISECIENSDFIQKELENDNFINLRGTMLPVLDLAEFFNVERSKSADSNVIVVKFGTEMKGFLVDEVFGKFQTVIKPVGELFQHIHEISGATILGNGEVSLIINVPSILKTINSQKNKKKAII